MNLPHREVGLGSRFLVVPGALRSEPGRLDKVLSNAPDSIGVRLGIAVLENVSQDDIAIGGDRSPDGSVLVRPGSFVIPQLCVVPGTGHRSRASGGGRILSNQQSHVTSIDIVIVVNGDTANRTKGTLYKGFPEGAVTGSATAPIVPDRTERWSHDGEKLAVAVAIAVEAMAANEAGVDFGHDD
jgi:hypothetical protein